MIPLDETDRRILRVLQSEGRLTNQELGDRVGLSSTPVWRRVKRMEDAGVILGYGARVSPTALGLSETVFVNVTLEHHTRDVQDRFAAEVVKLPEVQSADFLTGGSDFLLRVVVAGTEAYYDLLVERLYKLPGVKEVRSSFSLRTVKDSRALPL
ncbi:MAG: Lrp/AsnC family transcriptional regulator [Rhodospirillales bacterium]